MSVITYQWDHDHHVSTTFTFLSSVRGSRGWRGEHRLTGSGWRYIARCRVVVVVVRRVWFSTGGRVMHTKVWHPTMCAGAWHGRAGRGRQRQRRPDCRTDRGAAATRGRSSRGGSTRSGGGGWRTFFIVLLINNERAFFGNFCYCLILFSITVQPHRSTLVTHQSEQILIRPQISQKFDTKFQIMPSKSIKNGNQELAISTHSFHQHTIVHRRDGNKPL